jgi:cytochrome c-type biogenesis protein CcmH
MPTSFAVFLIGALLTASAAIWVLRAYRRAEGGAVARAVPVFAVCAALVAAALGIYLLIGRPDLPDAPYLARLEALKHRDPTSFNADEALAVLGAAARDNPDDPLPHLYSGQVLLETGRSEEAARAFDAALRREPQLADAMLGLGRAMVRIDDGRVSPEALRLFEQSGALSNDPAPWIYQAMAAMQEDRAADARRFWGEALTRMQPNDPRRAMAQRMSTETGR